MGKIVGEPDYLEIVRTNLELARLRVKATEEQLAAEKMRLATLEAPAYLLLTRTEPHTLPGNAGAPSTKSSIMFVPASPGTVEWEDLTVIIADAVKVQAGIRAEDGETRVVHATIVSGDSMPISLGRSDLPHYTVQLFVGLDAHKRAIEAQPGRESCDD